MSGIHFVDGKFKPSYINPITGMPYDVNWIFLEVTDDDSYNLFSGGNANVLRLAISKKCDSWQYRVCDFIEYELSYGKHIILSISKDDYEDAKQVYKEHSFKDNFLRPYEKNILVHSTTLDGFKSILQDKALKSWNMLKQEGTINESKPIGALLGDHEEYSDYIMFTHGGVTGEIIVNSKHHGRIIMSKNEEYVPGARLYFDAELIAKDGLLIRDGGHIKVKNNLPLEKYLMWYATIDNIDMKGLKITPYNFAMESDKEFERLFSIELEKR
ncbi:hypothetical protein [Alkaliphilus transvaalensis]|uniref:hypothetical protein n=1 Tax=Alkaliphilus transvaalensis TaxID=114628 RepID=UPI00047A045B|nr:hypothetical protein [Alkaliphilus transvaalensis]